MKKLFILLTCDYATKEEIERELTELNLGSVNLKVNEGIKIKLDANESKASYDNNQLLIPVTDHEEGTNVDWRNLEYIDVRGSVWIEETYLNWEASLVVIGESTQIFDLEIE